MAVEDIIIGRDPEDLEKYGKKGCIILGKHIVGKGYDYNLTNPVLMDVLRPHVILILGKRGSGKSYSSGVIAVTTYWYYRNSKHFVEYDVLFNTYYNWYDCKKTPELCTVNNKAMDLQTIALHETGHGIGLADVYQKACGGVVMYGYGSYGEVRRTLAQPDIAGLQMLYGV